MKINISCLLFFLSSFLALTAAYALEYFFSFEPCKICIYERIPYFAVLVVCILYFISQKKYYIFVIYILYLCNILLSIYHVGLEHNWFSDVFGCTDLTISSLDTFDDIKYNLLNANNLISCAERSAVFFGLSLVEWNLIYCIISVIVSYGLGKKYYEK